MQGQRSVLVAHGGSLGVTDQQDLDGFYRGLPHGGLMNGKISHAVGLRSPAGVGTQQDLDNISRGLETTGSVQGEVSTVVQARSLFGERGLLATAQQSAETLTKVVQFCVRHFRNNVDAVLKYQKE
jgi:hypothetical protein